MQSGTITPKSRSTFGLLTTIDIMKRTPLLAGLTALALLVTGCSTTSDEAATNNESGAAVERIVSLSPTATETLYEIGAGDKVVAADKNSNVPEEAPNGDLDGFKPNPEAVLAEEPDLVIASSDTNGLSEALAAADVELLVMPPATTFDDAYGQIEKIGSATDHTDEAKQLVEKMKKDIDAAIAEVPQDIRDSGVNYYHEADPSLYSVGDGTFIGQVYGLFGMKSIAGDSDDYPLLSNEAIIDANPEIIFLADHGSAGGVTAEAVSARPGWSEIDAVKEKRIIPLDPDLASRWGPRLPEAD